MFLKICGITRLPDALHAARHGADALGFVFWRDSPRHIDPPRAAEIIGGLPQGVMSVGVFVNESIDAIREIVAQTGISRGAAARRRARGVRHGAGPSRDASHQG